jgi:hypothetical protein
MPFVTVILCLLLAVLPLLRTCYVVATTGADCISNDDIIFLSLTETMWGGTYDWRHYFEDTFINGHCSAAAQALFLWLGPLVAWNQYWLCGVGIAMAVVRTHITARLLCAEAGEKLYWPVLALVSWTVFSFSQISLFTTGIFSIIWQSCLLFTTLAAYLLWKYPERLSAAIAASAFGLLACWNLAVGLPGWIVYFSIILLRGKRKLARAAVVAAGMVIASLPYLSFVMSGSIRSRKFSDQYQHWFDPTFFVNALGRPFANDIGSKFDSLPASELAGITGIIAFAILTTVMIASAPLRRKLVPCVVLCTWSVVVIAIIGVVRSGVAPWYALIAALFWAGITTASAIVIAEAGRTQRLFAAAPALFLVAVGVWTWQSNRSYIDKQYYLENRTAVSASVLRNYDVAPEVYASYVFKLPGLSTVVTAKMLERNRWSVFAPRQSWEMQGDSIFSLAEGHARGVDLIRAYWTKGRNQGAVEDFRSPRHLNLCLLNDGGSARWRVSIPRNARTAMLETAVNLDKRWKPISVDLSRYRGEAVTISFGNPSSRTASVFEYPRIELQCD